jgi:hypothetical protein
MDFDYEYDSNNQYKQDDEGNCIEYRSNDSSKSDANDLNKYLNIGLSIERYK